MLQTSHPLIAHHARVLFCLAALCCAALAAPRHPVGNDKTSNAGSATKVVNGTQEAVVRVSFDDPPREPVQVYVLTGQSVVLKFDHPIGRVSVSNQDFAEAVVVSPMQMVINGKASGRARFTTWARNEEQMIFIDADVRVNLAQIDSQVRMLFPKDDIRLSQANGSVVISGSADQKTSQQVEQVVQAAGFKTVNLLAQSVQDAAQVQLLVRVAEVSRNKLAEYAFSPAYQSGPGSGGYSNAGKNPYSLTAIDAGNIVGSVASSLNLFVMGGNAFAFLRALQQNGALRALAEPNLIAMNGQTASFLAGGEIPVPIVQGGGNTNNVTVQWKEYGVRVNFKPTIIDEQHIRLEVEPEVSSLDASNGIQLNGFTIPALRVRRAKTGIELQDGQSFGIAGLLDNSETKSVGKVPVLADVPILGNLFKSKSFQRNETELVFFVTAKITKPLNPDAVPRLREIEDLPKGSPLGIEAPKADSTASETNKPAAEISPVPVSVPVIQPTSNAPGALDSLLEPVTTPAALSDTANPGTTGPGTTGPGATGLGATGTDAVATGAPEWSPPAKRKKTATGNAPASQAFALMQWTFSPPTNDFKFNWGRALAAQLETKPK